MLAMPQSMPSTVCPGCVLLRAGNGDTYTSHRQGCRHSSRNRQREDSFIHHSNSHLDATHEAATSTICTVRPHIQSALWIYDWYGFIPVTMLSSSRSHAVSDTCLCCSQAKTLPCIGVMPQWAPVSASGFHSAVAARRIRQTLTHSRPGVLGAPVLHVDTKTKTMLGVVSGVPAPLNHVHDRHQAPRCPVSSFFFSSFLP